MPRNGDANAAWPATPYVTQRALRPAGQHGVVSMALAARSSSSSPRAGTLCVEDHPVTYQGYTYPHGKIAYIAGRGPAPAVMIHPNYAGAKQCVRCHSCPRAGARRSALLRAS